jgi:hypothetical protein
MMMKAKMLMIAGMALFLSGKVQARPVFTALDPRKVQIYFCNEAPDIFKKSDIKLTYFDPANMDEDNWGRLLPEGMPGREKLIGFMRKFKFPVTQVQLKLEATVKADDFTNFGTLCMANLGEDGTAYDSDCNNALSRDYEGRWTATINLESNYASKIRSVRLNLRYETYPGGPKSHAAPSKPVLIPVTIR